MWPFDEEETENVDPSLTDFSSVAEQIYEQSPDVETGLSSLRDLYSEYDFIDVTPANESLETYSNNIRNKFGDTKAFDYNTTLEFAPINMDDIIVKAEDPEEAKIERLIKWEEENLKALKETEDLTQIQAREQLEAGIRQTVTTEKRAYYGGDNYFVTDQMLRVGQGAVDPIAKLVGADSVSDWFVENTREKPNEFLGMEIGGDDSYVSAISSGAGSLVGAAASGAVSTVTTGTPAPGVYAYLGASGAGQVRERVEQAIDSGASTGEIVEAGAIEGASQLAQTLVGGKIFNRITGKIIGTPVKQFGARIFSKVPEALTASGAESLTEGTGQFASNISENIAKRDPWNKDLGRGIAKSAVAGGVVAFGGSAVGSFSENYREVSNLGSDVDMSAEGFASSFNDMTQQPSMESLEERAAGDLTNLFADYEGSPPPKPESIIKEPQTVNLESYDTVATLSDDTELVKSNGQLYYKKGEQIFEPFKQVTFVKPEVASKLKSLTAKTMANADGTPLSLKRDGKNLVLESEFTSDTLDPTPDKTGKEGIIIPGEAEAKGNVPIFVNDTSTQNGVRQNNFIVGEGIVTKGNLSAAEAGFDQKEHAGITTLRNKYGPEFSEDVGASVEQEQVYPDGTAVMKEVPLMTYFPKRVAEAGNEARAFIGQRGVYGTLHYLKNAPYTADNQAIAKVLLQDAIEMKQAIPPTDTDNRVLASDFINELLLTDNRFGQEAGRGQNYRTERGQAILSGKALGDFKVTEVKERLEQEAYNEIEKETKEKTTLEKAAVETKAADEVVDAIEKEIQKSAPKPKKKKEGEAPEPEFEGTPEQKAALDKAKRKQAGKKAALTRIQNKLEEKLKGFPEETQNELKNLYNLREPYIPGSEVHQKLTERIVDIETKQVKDATKAIDLAHIARRNALSGIHSQIGNIGGNAFKGTLEVVAHAATDLPQGSLSFLSYPYGAFKSLGAGLTEASEILQGNRKGRLSLGSTGDFKPEPLNLKRPFKSLGEVMLRALSAGDSLFFRAGSSGTGYMHMYRQAEKQKIPLLERKAWVDEKMFATEKKKEEFAEQVDKEIEVLKSAGVKTTPNERTLMIYERAQMKLDKDLRAIQERGGKTGAYLQDPEWGLGAFADIVSYASDRTTFQIPSTKRTKPIDVNAGALVAMFVRTPANVANELLNWTPIGIARAAYMQAFAKNIPAQGKGSRGEGRNKLFKQDLLIDSGKVDENGEPVMVPVSNELEIKATFGKGILGSALIGGSVGLALAALEDDEKNPHIEFYGAIPRGKYAEWKAAGKTPYSIRVGKSVWNVQNTPLAILPVIVDSIVQGKKKGYDMDIMAYNAIAGSIEAVSDLSFMKSASDFLDMFRKRDVGEAGGWPRELENTVGQQLTGVAKNLLLPTGFLGNFSKWINQSPLETYNNIQAKMFTQVPVVGAYAGEPALNRFAEPIKYNFWERTGMSKFYNEMNTDPVALWMQETGYNFVDLPRAVSILKEERIDIGKKFGGLDYSTRTTKEYKDALAQKGEGILKDITGYKDTLSLEQTREVLKITGPQIKNLLASKMKDARYNVFNEAQQKLIDDEVSKMVAKAKASILERELKEYKAANP